MPLSRQRGGALRSPLRTTRRSVVFCPAHTPRKALLSDIDPAVSQRAALTTSLPPAPVTSREHTSHQNNTIDSQQITHNKKKYTHQPKRGVQFPSQTSLNSQNASFQYTPSLNPHTPQEPTPDQQQLSFVKKQHEAAAEQTKRAKKEQNILSQNFNIFKNSPPFTPLFDDSVTGPYIINTLPSSCPSLLRPVTQMPYSQYIVRKKHPSSEDHFKSALSLTSFDQVDRASNEKVGGEVRRVYTTEVHDTIPSWMNPHDLKPLVQHIRPDSHGTWVDSFNINQQLTHFLPSHTHHITANPGHTHYRPTLFFNATKPVHFSQINTFMSQYLSKLNTTSRKMTNSILRKTAIYHSVFCSVDPWALRLIPLRDRIALSIARLDPGILSGIYKMYNYTKTTSTEVTTFHNLSHTQNIYAQILSRFLGLPCKSTNVNNITKTSTLIIFPRESVGRHIPGIALTTQTKKLLRTFLSANSLAVEYLTQKTAPLLQQRALQYISTSPMTINTKNSSHMRDRLQFAGEIWERFMDITSRFYYRTSLFEQRGEFTKVLQTKQISQNLAIELSRIRFQDRTSTASRAFSHSVDRLLSLVDQGPTEAKKRLETVVYTPETVAEVYPVKDPGPIRAKAKLPAMKYKDAFLHALNNHQTVLVVGGTGCGKSTQLPQFILDHMSATHRQRKCRVLVTQPRRVPCIALATRVAEEQGYDFSRFTESSSFARSQHSIPIGYQIQGQNYANNDSNLVFSTSGYVLKLITSRIIEHTEKEYARRHNQFKSLSHSEVLDILTREFDPMLDSPEMESFWRQGKLLYQKSLLKVLSSYSHIVVDEVHESCWSTNLLLSMVRDILPLLPDLRLILMSATANSDHILGYLDAQAVVYIEASTYPVDTYSLHDAVQFVQQERVNYKVQRDTFVSFLANQRALSRHKLLISGKQLKTVQKDTEVQEVGGFKNFQEVMSAEFMPKKLTEQSKRAAGLMACTVPVSQVNKEHDKHLFYPIEHYDLANRAHRDYLLQMLHYNSNTLNTIGTMDFDDLVDLVPKIVQRIFENSQPDDVLREQKSRFLPEFSSKQDYSKPSHIKPSTFDESDVKSLAHRQNPGLSDDKAAKKDSSSQSFGLGTIDYDEQYMQTTHTLLPHHEAIKLGDGGLLPIVTDDDISYAKSIFSDLNTHYGMDNGFSQPIQLVKPTRTLEPLPWGSVLIFCNSLKNISTVKQSLSNSSLDAEIVILHSQVGNPAAVAATITPGKRRVILATNIAETSLTFPDVVHVIDLGIAKSLVHNQVTNIPEFDEELAFKSALNQRRGRVGRVRPGVCFRLTTKQQFEAMAPYPRPETITNDPLDSIFYMVSLLNTSISDLRTMADTSREATLALQFKQTKKLERPENDQFAKTNDNITPNSPQTSLLLTNCLAKTSVLATPEVCSRQNADIYSRHLVAFSQRLFDSFSSITVLNSLQQLKDAGLLQQDGTITLLGKFCFNLPLSHSASRILLSSIVAGCLEHGLSLAAAFDNPNTWNLTEDQAILNARGELISGISSTLLQTAFLYETWAGLPHPQREAFVNHYEVNVGTLHKIHTQRNKLLHMLQNGDTNLAGLLAPFKLRHHTERLLYDVSDEPKTGIFQTDLAVFYTLLKAPYYTDIASAFDTLCASDPSQTPTALRDKARQKSLLPIELQQFNMNARVAKLSTDFDKLACFIEAKISVTNEAINTPQAHEIDQKLPNLQNMSKRTLLNEFGEAVTNTLTNPPLTSMDVTNIPISTTTSPFEEKNVLKKIKALTPSLTAPQDTIQTIGNRDYHPDDRAQLMFNIQYTTSELKSTGPSIPTAEALIQFITAYSHKLLRHLPILEAMVTSYNQQCANGDIDPNDPVHKYPISIVKRILSSISNLSSPSSTVTKPLAPINPLIIPSEYLTKSAPSINRTHIPSHLSHLLAASKPQALGRDTDTVKTISSYDQLHTNFLKAPKLPLPHVNINAMMANAHNNILMAQMHPDIAFKETAGSSQTYVPHKYDAQFTTAGTEKAISQVKSPVISYSTAYSNRKGRFLRGATEIHPLSLLLVPQTTKGLAVQHSANNIISAQRKTWISAQSDLVNAMLANRTRYMTGEITYNPHDDDYQTLLARSEVHKQTPDWLVNRIHLENENKSPKIENNPLSDNLPDIQSIQQEIEHLSSASTDPSADDYAYTQARLEEFIKQNISIMKAQFTTELDSEGEMDASLYGGPDDIVNHILWDLGLHTEHEKTEHLKEHGFRPFFDVLAEAELKMKYPERKSFSPAEINAAHNSNQTVTGFAGLHSALPALDEVITTIVCALRSHKLTDSTHPQHKPGGNDIVKLAEGSTVGELIPIDYSYIQLLSPISKVYHLIEAVIGNKISAGSLNRNGIDQSSPETHDFIIECLVNEQFFNAHHITASDTMPHIHHGLTEGSGKSSYSKIKPLMKDDELKKSREKDSSERYPLSGRVYVGQQDVFHHVGQQLHQLLHDHIEYQSQNHPEWSFGALAADELAVMENHGQKKALGKITQLFMNKSAQDNQKENNISREHIIYSTFTTDDYGKPIIASISNTSTEDNNENDPEIRENYEIAKTYQNSLISPRSVSINSHIVPFVDPTQLSNYAVVGTRANHFTHPVSQSYFTPHHDSLKQFAAITSIYDTLQQQHPNQPITITQRLHMVSLESMLAGFGYQKIDTQQAAAQNAWNMLTTETTLNPLYNLITFNDVVPLSSLERQHSLSAPSYPRITSDAPEVANIEGKFPYIKGLALSPSFLSRLTQNGLSTKKDFSQPVPLFSTSPVATMSPSVQTFVNLLNSTTAVSLNPNIGELTDQSKQPFQQSRFDAIRLQTAADLQLNHQLKDTTTSFSAAEDDSQTSFSRAYDHHNLSHHAPSTETWHDMQASISAEHTEHYQDESQGDLQSSTSLHYSTLSDTFSTKNKQFLLTLHNYADTLRNVHLRSLPLLSRTLQTFINQDGGLDLSSVGSTAAHVRSSVASLSTFMSGGRNLMSNLSIAPQGEAAEADTIRSVNNVLENNLEVIAASVSCCMDEATSRVVDAELLGLRDKITHKNSPQGHNFIDDFQLYPQTREKTKYRRINFNRSQKPFYNALSKFIHKTHANSTSTSTHQDIQYSTYFHEKLSQQFSQHQELSLSLLSSPHSASTHLSLLTSLPRSIINNARVSFSDLDINNTSAHLRSTRSLSRRYNSGTAGMYLTNITTHGALPRFSQRSDFMKTGLHWAVPGFYGIEYTTHITPELEDHNSATTFALLRNAYPHLDLGDIRHQDLAFEQDEGVKEDICEANPLVGSSDSETIKNLRGTPYYGSHAGFTPARPQQVRSTQFDDPITEQTHIAGIITRAGPQRIKDPTAPPPPPSTQQKRAHLLGRHVFKTRTPTQHRLMSLFFDNEFSRNLTNSLQYHSSIGQQLDLNKSMVSLDGQISLYVDHDSYHDVNQLYQFIQALSEHEYADMFTGAQQIPRIPGVPQPNTIPAVKRQHDLHKLKHTLLLRKTYQFINDLINNDPNYGPLPLSHYEVHAQTESAQYTAMESRFDQDYTHFMYNTLTEDSQDSGITSRASNQQYVTAQFSPEKSPFKHYLSDYYNEVELEGDIKEDFKDDDVDIDTANTDDEKEQLRLAQEKTMQIAEIDEMTAYATASRADQF